MIDDEIQDNAAVNSLSYFFPLFFASLCEIADSNKRFE